MNVMKKIIIAFLSTLFCCHVFSVDISSGTKLYLEPNIWEVDGARFAAYFFSGADYAWADFSSLPSGEESYYEATAPAGTWTNVIFCRMMGSAPENNWDNKWNQTEDLVFDGTNNLFSITGWGTEKSIGVWGLHVIDLDPVVSLAIPSAIYLGNELILNATTKNIENPVFKFSVKIPDSSIYTEISSSYTPDETGTYAFKVEAAAGNATDVILIADEKEVIVTEFSIGNGITIGVKKPEDWELISFYYWTENETGRFVSPTLYGEDFYVYSFENQSEINLIFVAGTSFSTDNPTDEEAAKIKWGKQSITLNGIDESRCFQIVDATYETGDDDWGKRRIRSIECPFEIPNKLNTTKTKTMINIENRVLNVYFEGIAQIDIFTINGQLIKSEKADAHFETQLNNGVYLLRLNESTHKIVVK